MGGALVALAALLAAAAVALTVYAALGLLFRERTMLSQLSMYDAARSASSAPRHNDAFTERVLEAVGQIAGKRGFTGQVRRSLERAGVPLRPSEAIFFHTLLVITVAVLTAVLGQDALVILAASLGAGVVPIYALQLLAKKRLATFEEQLPDVLALLSGSLRAGYGLVQAIDLIVHEMLPPASLAFGRVQAESRLGLPMEDALGAMAERLGSDDARWVVSAINIQREVGGNLAEVLDIVADTIRERAAVKRQVKTLTSEAKLSAVILTVLPFCVLGMLFVVSPDYVSPLLTTTFGQMMLATGAVMLVIGIVWIRKASTIEV